MLYKVITVFALNAIHISNRVKQYDSTKFLVHLCDFRSEEPWATVNEQQDMYFTTQLVSISVTVLGLPNSRTESSNLRS